MLTIKEVIKTFYNALLQRLKKHRGNWEQNDPTADDYIKNRPFYTDETKKETVVKTKTFTSENSYWWGSPFAFIPVVGETYKVTWDGKEYICTAYLYLDAPTIGNAAIDGDGPDTGEPFFYYWLDSYEYGLCVRDQGKHTITIEKIDVTKIDERYLPGNLARQESIDELYDFTNYIGNEVWNRVSYTQSQNLSTAQKQTARTNIGAVGYDAAQSLTNAQKIQARTNIGAVDNYNDLKNTPCKIVEDLVVFSGLNNTYGSRVNNRDYYFPISSSQAESLVIGQQYKVVINGDSTILTAKRTDYLGNRKIIVPGSTVDDNAEADFYLAFGSNYASLYLKAETSASSARLSVYKYTMYAETLDEILIPDTIARVSELLQSDWNQNDSEQTDYIKNRTHYEELIVGETLYEGYDLIGIDNQTILHPLYNALDEGHIAELVVGENTYRGIVKKTTIQPDLMYYIKYIGNLSLKFPEDGENTGEDYLYAVYYYISSGYTSFSNRIYINNQLVSDNTIKTIIRYPDETKVYQLDEKFIPDTIARTSDLAQVAITGSYNDLLDLPFSSECLTEEILSKINIGSLSDHTYSYPPTDEIISALEAEISVDAIDILNDRTVLEKVGAYTATCNVPTMSLKGSTSGQFKVAEHTASSGETYKSYYLGNPVYAYNSGFAQRYNFPVEEHTGEAIIIVFTYYNSQDNNDLASCYISMRRGVYTNQPAYFSLTRNYEEVKTLDEKFIPSTIARTEDIEGLATEEYVDTKVSDLVNAAPEALDTLKELSTALGDDPNFATTVLTQLGNKADITSLEGLATESYVDQQISALGGRPILNDSVTGTNYMLYVENGKLTMQETDVLGGTAILKDAATGLSYELYVVNGELTMKEAE